METEEILELRDGDIIFINDLWADPSVFFFVANYPDAIHDETMMTVRDGNGEIHFLFVSDIDFIATMGAMM